MRSSKELIKIAQQGGLIVGKPFTAYLLNYEAGTAARCAQYAVHTDGVESEGYRAHLQTEMADLLTQARMLLELYDLPWQETMEMGEAKLIETAEKFQKLNINTMDRILGRERIVRTPTRREGD